MKVMEPEYQMIDESEYHDLYKKEIKMKKLKKQNKKLKKQNKKLKKQNKKLKKKIARMELMDQSNYELYTNLKRGYVELLEVADAYEKKDKEFAKYVKEALELAGGGSNQKTTEDVFDDAMREILKVTPDNNIEVGFEALKGGYISFDNGASKIRESSPLYDAFYRVKNMWSKFASGGFVPKGFELHDALKSDSRSPHEFSEDEKGIVEPATTFFTSVQGDEWNEDDIEKLKRLTNKDIEDLGLVDGFIRLADILKNSQAYGTEYHPDDVAFKKNGKNNVCEIPSWRYKHDENYPLNPKNSFYAVFYETLVNISEHIGMPIDRLDVEFIKLCKGKSTKSDLMPTMLFGSINKTKKTLRLPNNELLNALTEIVDNFTPLKNEDKKDPFISYMSVSEWAKANVHPDIPAYDEKEKLTKEKFEKGQKLAKETIEELKELEKYCDEPIIAYQNWISTYLAGGGNPKQSLKDFKEHILSSSTPMSSLEAENAVKNDAIQIWNTTAHYEPGTPVIYNGEKLYAFEIGVPPSRFMPNVKFKIPDELTHYCDFFRKHSLAEELDDDIWIIHFNRRWFFTNSDGNILTPCKTISGFKEVSIYEAMPEIPESMGMVYDKESGSLKSMDFVIVNDGFFIDDNGAICSKSKKLHIPDGMVYDKKSDSLKPVKQ